MTDTGMITRPGDGEAELDPETGALTPPDPETVQDEGPCRVRMPTTIEMNRLFGEEDVSITRYVAVFPWDSSVAQIGDLVTITESDDPSLLGAPFRVVLIPRMTHLMYRAYGCEVVE